MPVHPSEEEAPSGIFEKVAKDPSSTTESTASDHGTMTSQLESSLSAAATPLPANARERNLSSRVIPRVATRTLDQRLTRSLVEHHENEHTPGKASAQDHQSKGPAIPMNMSGKSLTGHCGQRHIG